MITNQHHNLHQHHQLKHILHVSYMYHTLSVDTLTQKVLVAILVHLLISCTSHLNTTYTIMKHTRYLYPYNSFREMICAITFSSNVVNICSNSSNKNHEELNNEMTSAINVKYSTFKRYMNIMFKVMFVNKQGKYKGHNQKFKP